jgi:hypothetical protein
VCDVSRWRRPSRGTKLASLLSAKVACPSPPCQGGLNKDPAILVKHLARRVLVLRNGDETATDQRRQDGAAPRPLAIMYALPPNGIRWSIAVM